MKKIIIFSMVIMLTIPNTALAFDWNFGGSNKNILCKVFKICDPVDPPAPDPTSDPVPDPTPTPNPNPKPYTGSGMITFSFDDGLDSTYSLAAPILSDYNYPATAYVFTQALNENMYGHMTWDQVVSLQNDYNFEVGSHAYSHDNLTSMAISQAEWEITKSLEDLKAHGLNVESFATPYGAHSTDIVNFVAKNFSSHRTAWNLNNTFPVNDYYLKARPVGGVSVSTIKLWIDSAKANDEWLILYIHELAEGYSDGYTYDVANFSEIVKYVNDIELPVVTTKDGIKAFADGDNQVFNGTFEHGYNYNAENWVRSNYDDVKVVRWNWGAYPEAHSHAWIDGDSTRQRSISTYAVDVNDWQDYRLKAFFRVTNYVSGGTSVWVSEFDENYRYVGGQWLGGFSNNFLGTKVFEYNPTNGTEKIEIYFISHAGSLIKQEIDNVELRAR